MNAIEARLRTQESVKNQFDFECKSLLQYIYIASGNGSGERVCYPRPSFEVKDEHIKFLTDLGYKVTKEVKVDMYGFKDDNVRPVPFTISWE